MKKNSILRSIIVCFFLTFVFQSFGQEDYSQYLSSFTETTPPTGEIRFPAEFEPVQAVIIAYPLHIPVTMVKEMAKDCKVITIINSGDSSVSYMDSDEKIIEYVKSEYSDNNINTENCEFVVSKLNGHWTRDFAPWCIFKDGKPAIVDNIYDRVFPGSGNNNPSQVLDDAMSAKFAELYNIPLYGMKVVHTGGNMMQDGRGIGVSDSIVITESEKYVGVDADAVHQKMNDYLGIDTYHVTIDPQGDYIAHVDCWGKFLAPDKILLAEVPSTHAQYEKYESVASYFKNTNCCWGYPYKVYRVNVPNGKIAPYTNSLILNKKVFVPISSNCGDAEANKDALNVYREAMPGYEIYGIDYDTEYYEWPYGTTYESGWKNTDALHCRTREVMDFNMLFVDHRNVIFGERSLKDSYPITAKFIAYSGDAITATELHYSINGGEYQTITMAATVNADEYTANITGCEIGDVVNYYITGEDASGRSCAQPVFKEQEPHTFTVVNGIGKDDDDNEEITLNTFTGTGSWLSATNWSTWNIPADNEDVIIAGNVTIPPGATVIAGNIQIKNGTITIADGGQLIHDQEGLIATMEKNISGYSTDEGWHTISSPIEGNVNIDEVGNMTSNEYDLYYYDEPTHYWYNHKVATNEFTTLDEGRGYLYANSNDTKLQFTGELNVNSVQYELTTDGNELNGFHLIGNPYAHDIYIGQAINPSRKTRETLTVEFVMSDNGGDFWNGGNGNFHYLTVYYGNTSSEEITFKWNGDDQESSRTIVRHVDESQDFHVTFTGYKWTSECSLIIRINGEEVFNKDGSYFGKYSDTDGDATGNTVEIYRYTASSGEGEGNEDSDNTSVTLSEGYYTLSNDGAWGTRLNSNDAIAPCQGILIKTLNSGTLTINKTHKPAATTRAAYHSISINVANAKYKDEAYIMFKDGIGLNKIGHMNENIPMVYVTDNDEHFAIATMNKDAKEINIGFEAMTMGEYTISVNAKDCKFSTMTLTDKLTGEKTDLLSGSYTFMATTTDNPQRFVLTLNSDADSDADFIYINNSEMIINNIEGAGHIVIFDIMGRPVAEYNANGSANINIETLANGVYVVRMTDDNGIKTQKIIRN